MLYFCILGVFWFPYTLNNPYLQEYTWSNKGFEQHLKTMYPKKTLKSGLSFIHDPSFQEVGGVTCRRTVAPMIMLFLRSPMRIMKHKWLFLTAMTAWRLKMSVSARRLD